MRDEQATRRGAGSPGEIERLAAEIGRLDRAARRWSAARLASFAALIAGAVAGIESAPYALAICPAALAAFALCVVIHTRVLDRRDALEARRTLLSEALDRARTRRRSRRPPPVPANPTPLERGLRVYGPEPESLALDAATADDLALFETASPGPDAEPEEGAAPRREAARTLFGLLDASITAFGSRRLRHILLHPLRRADDIRARQEAVAEMARRADVRERLLAGLLPLRGRDLAPLARFFSEPPAFARRTWLLLWANLVGTAAPAALAAVIVTGDLDLLAVLFPLLALSFATIAAHGKKSNPARERILLFGPLLGGLLRLEDALAAVPLSAAAWREITAVLRSLRPHAARLRRHIALLALHDYGALFELWNLLTLWELRILPVADAVIARHRKLLEDAAGALGEAEALVSLSLPLAEQPGFELPRILEAARPEIAAEEVGHPLLEPAAAVRNPVSLGSGANVLLVTGSNMAGKSTYIKSVAVNLLLAGAGGPVCAAGFRWTPMALHSDINVRDSLDDGKSYFQVEVERVRRVIEAARESPFLLAVFDELFRGTNSEERIALARAIVRHLRSTGALLIVATHDLALTRLVTEDREPGIENRHFRETVEDGVMRFDYRLREGPAATRNAIRVLEAQGYPEEITREARESARAEPNAGGGRTGA